MASASNYAAILTAIKALLETVSGIGIVHKSQRLTTDWTSFVKQFVDDDGFINGWTISRRTSPETYKTNTQAERKYTFVIRGFRGVQDAAEPHSELVFQELVEAVCDVFRADYDLGEACEFHGPLQVNVVDYRMFGGVLCHYAEAELTAQELLLGG